MIPVALLVAVVGVNILTRHARERPPAAKEPTSASAWLSAPYPLDHFTAVDLDGRPVSSAAWRGQVAVVNFWATWCPPCRREIPALAALQERYRGRVVVVGIVDDSASDQVVRQFASTLRVNYPLVRTTMDLSRRFPSVEALPTTVLIDAGGLVSAAYAGEVPIADLERDILRLLATASGAAVPRG
jgi:cytochrome c biogenesis protein CcmG/thiol:disulfide interchange protein DsbE